MNNVLMITPKSFSHLHSAKDPFPALSNFIVFGS
jgi:hypothetical protein